jgi:hypothetical protein
MQRDLRMSVERQVVRLKVELATIEEWNRLFAHQDCNEDSYLARERRRSELLIKIRVLSDTREAPLH